MPETSGEHRLEEASIRLSDEAEARLPEIAGGISAALARCFRILSPDLRNPRTEHWEQAHRIFDLLL